MLRPVNVATPAAAGTVVAPPSVAPGSPVPPVMAMETLPVNPVTVLPKASRTETRTAGEIPWPAGAVTGGCTLKASLEGALAVTSNAALPALANPAAVAVSVYPLCTLSMLRSANVATPFTALRIVVPERVAPFAFAPSVMVMTVLAVVTVLPTPSCTATRTPGLHDESQLRGGSIDVEAGARRFRQPGRRGGKRVARPDLVEAQVAEGGHAVHGAANQGPGELAAGRVSANGDRDQVRRRGDGVPQRVLDRGLHGRRDRGADDRGARLDRERQSRRSARRDVERAARRCGDAAGGGGQRVAGSRLGDTQVGEGGDAVHRTLAGGPNEGAAGRSGADGERNDRRGAGDGVAELILHRNLDRRSDGPAGPRGGRLHGEREPRGETRGDDERRAHRTGQSGGRGRQRVRRARLVDAQIGERGDPVHRGPCGGSGEGAAAGVGPDADRNDGRRGAHGVPEGVLHRDLDGRRDRTAGRRRAGGAVEDELTR